MHELLVSDQNELLWKLLLLYKEDFFFRKDVFIFSEKESFYS